MPAPTGRRNPTNDRFRGAVIVLGMLGGVLVSRIWNQDWAELLSGEWFLDAAPMLAGAIASMAAIEFYRRRRER